MVGLSWGVKLAIFIWALFVAICIGITIPYFKEPEVLKSEKVWTD